MGVFHQARSSKSFQQMPIGLASINVVRSQDLETWAAPQPTPGQLLECRAEAKLRPKYGERNVE